MIPQFSNTSNASFLLWVENRLLSKGLAYQNYTGELVYQKDYQLDPKYNAYASCFKQWVYDRSISGAIICTGVFGSMELTTASGIKIDYNNGRVLVPSGYGTGLNLNAAFAFKDINVYLYNETEEKLLTSEKLYLNPRFGNKAPNGTGIPPYAFVTPALFLVNLHGEQLDFALGGLYDSRDHQSIVVMTEVQWQLDAVISIFRDAQYKYFPQVSMYAHPLDEYGDVKSSLYPSGYSYNDIIAQYGQPGNLFCVQKVRSSKLSDHLQINEKLFVGIIQVETSKIRNTV